ncbi:CDGSH iron-sulfur domain-containing protein [soil metagenome]
MQHDTSKPSIRVLDKGPLHVRGQFELIDQLGNKYHVGEQFTLCRCGASAKAPFCDGSHRMSKFQDCSRAPTVAATAGASVPTAG